MTDYAILADITRLEQPQFFESGDFPKLAVRHGPSSTLYMLRNKKPDNITMGQFRLLRNAQRHQIPG